MSRRPRRSRAEKDGAAPSEAPHAPPAPQIDPDTGLPLCALCERPVPPDARQSWHHLVPKLRGGKGGPVVLVHQICGLR
jgi:hypothetical protein